jgi:hypothetical protein
MSDPLQEVRAELRLIRIEIAELKSDGKPGLTVTEFAKKIGRSRWTVQKMHLRKVKGRIPYSELKKFLS